MTFCPQIDWFFRRHFSLTSWFVSFLYLFLRALGRSAGRFGVCHGGVEVFSRQLSTGLNLCTNENFRVFFMTTVFF